MTARNRNYAIEEIANAVTHGLGLALSVAGFAVLLIIALLRGDKWQIAGCAIYGITLVFLYLASTLYHSVKSPRAKQLLKLLDHCAIYFMIAGTYTPFTLVNLRGVWGWTLLSLIWSLCVGGVIFKFWSVNKLQPISTVLYIVMGWLCLIAIKPLIQFIPAGGLAWLLAGGFLYSGGVVFFGWHRVRYNHAIWHLFVLAGSICHYFAVVFYVLPKG